MKVSVFGGGSWGSAMAHQLARREHEVCLWALEPEVVEGINTNRRNPLFISDLELHSGIHAVNDLRVAARHSSIWVWVVPVQFSQSVMQDLAAEVDGETVVVSASKGIETGTLRRMDEVAGATLGVSIQRFCCLSGPTFAREVIRGDPSAAVLGMLRPGSRGNRSRKRFRITI